MEFRVLGPLEVRDGDRAVVLGGAKPRAVLAQLLVHANEVVSAERLALGLWGEDAPAGAVKTVQVHVARLRRALGEPEALATDGAGYRLRVEPGELDADRFERWWRRAGRELAAGDAGAGEALREALALWRGPPLSDLAAAPFAPAEIARLEEQRLEATELRVQADLETGRHAELIAELGRLMTREHPLRERLHAQLMLALYRSGRRGRRAGRLPAGARGAASTASGSSRARSSAALHRAVLRHDPALAPPRRRDGRIPALPNRTVGRAPLLATLAGRVREERLLTLTGPGGVGKTRLAIEVRAHE